MAEDDDYNPDLVDQGEDLDADDGVKYEPSKELVVILIDASQQMLDTMQQQPDEEEEDEGPRTFLATAMDLAAELMKLRIMSAVTDELAVVFYGAAKTNLESQVFENVYVYAPLEVPDASTIRKLQDFSVDQFQEEVGTSDAHGMRAAENLKFALWYCKDLLTSSKSAHSSKRILLFTACENPCSEDPDMLSRDQIMIRAEELGHINASLDFFPLAALNGPFNMKGFWNEVIAKVASSGGEEGLEEEQQEEGPESVQAKVDAFYTTVRKKSFKKRPLAHLRWTITPGLEIAVQLYTLLQPATKRAPIMLHARELEAIKPVTAYLCVDSGELLTDTSRRYFQPSAGNVDRVPRVMLRAAEVKAVKQVRQQGLVLLGFKPRKLLADHHQLSHAHFLFPDERSVKGSTSAFVALHKAMLVEDTFALCRFVRSNAASPQHVALLAQEEVCDEFGNQITPGGMHLITLPFKDDIRAPESHPSVTGTEPPLRADESQIAAAEALAKALNLVSFDPSEIRNPALQRHFDIIEKIALGDSLEDEAEDDTAVDVAGIDRHRGVLTQFRDAVFGADYEERKAAAAAGKKAAPKRKDAPELTQTEIYQQHDWAKLAESEKGLAKLTNDILKVYCAHHKLPTGGRKADLVSRIRAHQGMD